MIQMSGELSQKLNLLMAEARINAEELSRRIGLPASTIKKIRNNQDANPTLSTIAPIAKYFALTISELVGEVELPKSRIKGTYRINDEALNRVPLISWQNAINWPDSSVGSSKSISTEHRYSENAFALLVEEDNWENLVKGTALLIDPEIEIEHRDFIIVHKNGQQLPVLKQALFDDGNIYLKPAVIGYQLTILSSEHRVLGVVVEYKKNLKNYR